MIFDKGAKEMQWRIVFSTDDAGTTGHPCKNKSGHRAYTLYKNNFKRITVLNAKMQNHKTPRRQHIGKKPRLGHGNDFLHTTQKA